MARGGAAGTQCGWRRGRRRAATAVATVIAGGVPIGGGRRCWDRKPSAKSVGAAMPARIASPTSGRSALASTATNGRRFELDDGRAAQVIGATAASMVRGQSAGQHSASVAASGHRRSAISAFGARGAGGQFSIFPIGTMR